MKYSTCLLASEFEVSEVDLHPGQSFPHSDHSVQLAGGFSSLFPETSFPLSSTLQLNNDLSTLSTDVLEKVAKAELDRFNSVSFKTYVVDPNMHVCVVSEDAEALEAFLNTYGGLLEIDPVLVKTSHEDHAQVTEVAIENVEHGYEVHATQRSPIDMDACTYCGACGPACPENCISPSLRVEYSKCTFCRECEKVCQAKAVDIYGVEKRTIRTPSVVLLGSMKLNLPEDQSGIYQEDDLQKYFATLFSTEIEEVISCNKTICQYSSKLKKGCSLCHDACQFNAIKLDESGISIDYQLCNECGACTSVCPTGSMQHRKFTDTAFIEYFRNLSIAPSTTVVIGDSDTLHQLWWQEKGREELDVLFLEYPVVEALSLFHFLYLVGLGAGQVLLLTGKESTEDELHVKKLESVNRIIGSLIGMEDAIQTCGVEELEQCLEAPAVNPLKTAYSNYSLVNRREKIADLLAFFHAGSTDEITVTKSDYSPFATVVCDKDRCTQCFACLNECKITALKAAEDEKTLTYTSSLCIGCNVCAHVCPENALKVHSEALISTAFFQAAELSKAEPMLCKECGKEFGTKKGFEKVMSILASKNMTDKGHFEYCDTCRVVKLFETNRK